MEPYYQDDLVTLYHGDAASSASALAPCSVQTIVTSPPYYGLRDYGVDGQLGAEESVGEYVTRLADVFDALRPALADDGTLWLNLGDSYAARPGNRRAVRHAQVGASDKTDLPLKNLLGVPWRVAFELQARGWILRSEIIWHKPNAMPESVSDRPTRTHEQIFLFAKSAKYHFDADAVTEAATGRPSGNSFARPEQIRRGGRGNEAKWQGSETRNIRSVWSVTTEGFPEAHFATYPTALVRPYICAGSAVGDTVLDPFSGSGTTGMVALQEGRRYVGIDLNRDYLDLSLRTRFASPPLNFGSLVADGAGF